MQQSPINALSEIESYNNKIIIVLNKSSSGDYDRAKKVFDEFDISYPVFEIKKSTAFSKSVEQKKSLKQLASSNPLFSFHYSKPLHQLENIISFIKSYGEQ